MSRQSRKHISPIADWEVSDATIAGWWWPEDLARRQQKPVRRSRLKRLRYRLSFKRHYGPNDLPF